jgi:hypothetical protein
MNDEIPDIYGLPVYRANRCIKKRVGDEIHMLVGQDVFGQIIWSHVEIWNAGDALPHFQEINDMAKDAAWFCSPASGEARH